MVNMVYINVNYNIVSEPGKPYFISRDKMQLQFKNAVAGETLRLSCPFDGIPEPTIKWYKNSDLLNGTERENGESVTIFDFIFSRIS